jgi:hypothetical protein
VTLDAPQTVQDTQFVFISHLSDSFHTPPPGGRGLAQSIIVD